MGIIANLAEWCKKNIVNYGERSCILKHLGTIQDAKDYREVIEHLNHEGHKFSDMQLCIRLISFVYNKELAQIRKDLWAENQKPR